MRYFSQSGSSSSCTVQCRAVLSSDREMARRAGNYDRLCPGPEVDRKPKEEEVQFYQIKCPCTPCKYQTKLLPLDPAWKKLQKHIKKKHPKSEEYKADKENMEVYVYQARMYNLFRRR